MPVGPAALSSSGGEFGSVPLHGHCQVRLSAYLAEDYPGLGGEFHTERHADLPGIGLSQLVSNAGGHSDNRIERILEGLRRTGDNLLPPYLDRPNVGLIDLYQDRCTIVKRHLE